MEKGPNLTATDEIKKEKRKFTATIVDTTDLMKEQATDVGNEKMTMEAESEELANIKGWRKMGKGEFWSRLGQQVWKYGLKRNYNLNNEIYKASQEILKTENVFVGEGKGKDAHDKVMADILDQFTSGYEETIHKEAGEKKVTLGKNELEEEATGDKAATKQLIMDWATGKIDKAAFKAQEERLFHQLKGNQDDKEVKENVMHVSNLFEVAEQVKLAIKNQEFLENEDFEFDVVYGKSRAGVRSEEHFNKTERIMNKMLSSKVGQFANETTIAIALSCVASLAVKSIATLPGKIVPIVGTALISSGFAKKREEMEQIRKRTAHFREMAKGKTFDEKRMPVRAEMESTNYKTESAGDLLKNIDENLKILETNGEKLTSQELNSIFAELSKLEALIRLSDRRRIDMITYSDSTKVVEERKNLDIKGRLIKDALRKVFENGGNSIPNGLDFDKYFDSLATTEENRMISEENTGIDAKDRDFNKIKSEKGNKAAWRAFKTGIIVGTTFQEVASLFTGRVGIIEDIAHEIKGTNGVAAGVGVQDLTMAAYVKHLIQGDLPKVNVGSMHEVLVGGNHIKLPEGVNMVQNPDGTYNLVGSGGKVFGEHLTTNPDGTFTPEAKNILARNGVNMDSHLTEKTINKSVSVDEHVKNASGMKDVHHRMWMDNNTAEFDQNELATKWGGVNGTGIDANGNYVLNVGHMSPDGSFHGDISADAQELMKAGQLKMLFSMSDGTQNKVFEFTVTPQGEIVIPPGSDAGKLLFSNVGGHADFHGRFGEVAQDMGDGNYRMLGTLEGKGLKDVIDTVTSHNQETILRMHGSYDWTPPPFIPIVPGDPLETLKKDQKEKVEKAVLLGAIAVKEGATDEQKVAASDAREEADKVNSELLSLIDKEKINEEGKNMDLAGVILATGSSKIEKQKTLNEVSKEEYDGMYDDLKMINRKVQSNEGIVTLEESDFKSAYGKKRYNDLKHIQEGKPVTWNKEELQNIGNELEGLLSNSKRAMSGEEKAQKNERDIFAEYEKFVAEHPNEKIPVEMEQRYKKAEEVLAYEKAKTEERIIFAEYEKFVAEHPNEKIPVEMEDRYRQAEEKVAKAKEIVGNIEEQNADAYKTGDVVEFTDTGIKHIEKSEGEDGTGIKTNQPEAKPKVVETVLEQSPVEKVTPKEVLNEEKTKPEVVQTITPEITQVNERVFTSKDLSKIGTEFESGLGTYTVTKITKKGGMFNIFSKTKIEVIHKDKNGDEILMSYDKKALEDQLKKGFIKINKVEEEK
jgi:hypothetical protein